MYDQQTGQRKRVVKKPTPAVSPVTTFVIVFIVILFVVASFAAGYYVGSNFKIDLKAGAIEKTDNKDKAESSVTNFKANDPRITTLIDKLTKHFGTDCWSIEDFANDRAITAVDVSNYRAFKIAENNNFYSSGRSSISVDEVNEEIRKYLGKEYRFEPTLVKYDETDCTQYQYNPDKKQFERIPNNTNRICPYYEDSYKILKAIDVGGELEVYLKVLFGSKEGYYYSDYARQNIVAAGSENLATFVALGQDYLFKFKNEDGNYVFVSSEPIIG